MYFDFGDGHPDLQRLPRALSTREEVFVAIIIHLLVIIALLVVPRLPFMKARALAVEQARLAKVAEEQDRRKAQQPFMFVQPQLDVRSRVAPPKAPPSDMNRQAMTMQRPPEPKNSQPFMKGNTTEFTEASKPTPQSGAQVQGPPTPTVTLLIFPSRPLRISSTPSRKLPNTFDRCWLPVCTIRLCVRAASTHRCASVIESVSGFSQ